MDQRLSYLFNKINEIAKDLNELANNGNNLSTQNAFNLNNGTTVTVTNTPTEVYKILEVTEAGNYELNIEAPILMNSGKNESITISLYSRVLPDTNPPTPISSDVLGGNLYLQTSASAYGHSNNEVTVRLCETLPNLPVGTQIFLYVESVTSNAGVLGVINVKTKQYSNDINRIQVNFDI